MKNLLFLIALTIISFSCKSTINPDNVNVDPVTTPNNSLTNLTVWLISSTGQLIQTYVAPMGEVLIPKSVISGEAILYIGHLISSNNL